MARWARHMGTALALGLAGCAAPPLDLADPGRGPHAGAVHLAYATAADRAWVSVDGADPVRVAPAVAVLDTRQWADGEHVITLTARAPLSRTSSVTATVLTDNSPPQVSLAARSTTVEQGHTLPIVVTTDEPATIALTFLDRARTPYTIAERTARALVGVPIRTQPGRHDLTIEVTDALGNHQAVVTPVTVVDVVWPFTGKLPLSKKKAKVELPEMEQMRAERDAVYAAGTPTAVWTGPMTLPVSNADHSSPFGTYREYPDGKRSHHDAEDLARKRWTPIAAAGDGTVALARMQAVHGNAVLLDHGQKVVTLYSHLQKLAVTEGQPVETGDLLGWMGSTGRSTGPHLHWGIVVDEVAVDPMQWTTESFEPDTFGDLVPLEPAAVR